MVASALVNDTPDATAGTPSALSPVSLSVVIPVLNEAENVVPLLNEIAAALSDRSDWEVLFVDDGSTDGTAAALQPRLGARVRLVRHAERRGQSTAIRTGVRAARGTWIATLDGDGQNDPADIPALWARTLEGGGTGLAMVAGLRRKRNDSLSKRLASRLANGIRNAILHDGCRDTGCGLKLFRRDAFLDLPFFSAVHRFLPALFLAQGHTVAYVEVNHRPRRAGTSKYGNLGRALVGVVDLMGVYWLQRRGGRPATPREEMAREQRPLT
ncbi:MAG TPA: glycosyltransferase family 2 protein [Azospirillaceae bacterium]|nr:glycosyltransferase family 2 protein [Azospirillaceae bacterium]